MSDLISRQDAIDDAREMFKKNPTMAIRVMDLIKSMPSAGPEVIRCIDCKHIQTWRSEKSAEKFGQAYECGISILG